MARPAKKLRRPRRKARRDYLRYSKQRKHGRRDARMARRQQLQYLRRDLACIDALLDDGHESRLPIAQARPVPLVGDSRSLPSASPYAPSAQPTHR